MDKEAAAVKALADKMSSLATGSLGVDVTLELLDGQWKKDVVQAAKGEW